VGPLPGGLCGVGVIVSCDEATGIWTNDPRRFDLVLTTTLNATIPVA
jgi:hypothetical protein